MAEIKNSEQRMTRQEFIDSYLDYIIDARKKYHILEQSKVLPDREIRASEIEHICQCQNDIAEKLVRFILYPKVHYSLENKKLIEDNL